MRTICLLACLIGMAMSAWSQNLVLGQEEEADDAIAVVGYFCKNDSMTFRQTHQKYKIQEGDTTISEDYAEEFLIVVTDSTSDGYKMKYVPLSFTLNDADTITAIMTNAMSQLMQSVVCEFTTDELGLLKSITNWREIRDQLRKSVKVVCDSLYGTIPELDSITPRKSLENLLLLQFSTEQGIRNSYEELNTLFGLHGSMFDIGDKELDSEENGYPQHILARIGYTPVEDEENDFDGDYVIVTQTTTIIPVEDALDYGLGTMSMMMSDMIADSLNAVRDMIVDTIKAAMPQGIEMKVNEYYGYFLNGWPKECYYSRAIDMGISKNVETRSIEWISRHWNIYVRDDESTENKDI